jgi:tripartite-type tricarboxylate transporter receptor subunit TctC
MNRQSRLHPFLSSIPRLSIVGAVFTATLTSGGESIAQSQFPSKPIQIVVPFSPGGSSDVIARQLGEKLAASLKQSVIVENKPGAGTLIGTEYVANAAPDGHTLLLADVPFSVNPSVVKSARYDPVKDFAPIAIIGASAQFLYAHPSRFKSLSELVAAAKANPGKVSVANAGNGTTTHLMTEMLEAGAGIELLQVQYKGSAPALSDTAAGHTDAVFSTLASAAPLVQAGKLRVIGVTSKERLPTFPDVQTFAEIGAKDMVVEHWWGLLAPAGVPKVVVDRLNQEVTAAMKTPEIQERLKSLTVEPRTSTPEEFGKLVASYVERWARVVKEHGIEVK